MYPVLLHIGPLAIFSYGLSLAVAFLVGTFVVWRNTRDNFSAEQLLDGIFVSIVCGLVAGRSVYVVTHLAQIGFSLPHFVGFLWYGGFDGYATLLGGFLGLLAWSWKRRWDFFQLADAATPGIVIAFSVIILGDFLGGVSIGKVSSLPWALLPPSVLEPRQPVALYELLVLFLALYLAHQVAQVRPFAEKLFTGSIFLSTTFFLFAGTFLVEFARDDRLYLRWFTEGQLVSLLAIIVCAVVLFQRSARLRRKKEWLREVGGLLAGQVRGDVMRIVHGMFGIKKAGWQFLTKVYAYGKHF